MAAFHFNSCSASANSINESFRLSIMQPGEHGHFTPYEWNSNDPLANHNEPRHSSTCNAMTSHSEHFLAFILYYFISFLKKMVKNKKILLGLDGVLAAVLQVATGGVMTGHFPSAVSTSVAMVRNETEPTDCCTFD